VPREKYPSSLETVLIPSRGAAAIDLSSLKELWPSEGRIWDCPFKPPFIRVRAGKD